MFKALKLIKNLIFLLLFISSVSAHAEEQSLAEPQNRGNHRKFKVLAKKFRLFSKNKKSHFSIPRISTSKKNGFFHWTQRIFFPA